jgi:hypothetical protein
LAISGLLQEGEPTVTPRDAARFDLDQPDIESTLAIDRATM